MTARIPAILHLGDATASDAVGKAECIHFFNKKASTSLDLSEPLYGVPWLSSLSCDPEDTMGEYVKFLYLQESAKFPVHFPEQITQDRR